MSVSRTASRLSIRASSSSGRNPSIRVQSPTYGIARLLRLHPDQVLDHLGGRAFHPPEQQLPLEQRPVELSRG